MAFYHIFTQNLATVLNQTIQPHPLLSKFYLLMHGKIASCELQQHPYL